MPESIENTPRAEDRAAALLVVEMPSDWRFAEGDTLLRGGR